MCQALLQILEAMNQKAQYYHSIYSKALFKKNELIFEIVALLTAELSSLLNLFF